MADKKISALTASTTPLAGTEVLPIVQSGSTVKVAVSDLTTGRAVSMSGLTVTGQTASLGPGGTGASNAVFTINGSSASSYGPYVIFQRNSVSQWFVGTDSGINGGTSDDLILYSASNNLRLYNDVRAMNGNVVIGTAGKGIDFSATAHLAGMTSELFNDYEEGTFIPTLSGATTTTYTTQTGRYTKIGRQIFFHCEIEINSLGNGSTTIVLLGDLPTALSSPFSTISVGFFSGIATAVSSLTGYIGAAGANSVQFQSLVVAATGTAPNAVFANGSRVMFSGQYSV